MRLDIHISWAGNPDIVLEVGPHVTPILQLPPLSPSSSPTFHLPPLIPTPPSLPPPRLATRAPPWYSSCQPSNSRGRCASSSTPWCPPSRASAPFCVPSWRTPSSTSASKSARSTSWCVYLFDKSTHTHCLQQSYKFPHELEEVLSTVGRRASSQSPPPHPLSVPPL